MEELVKEQPVYEIQKVKIKNNQLTAEYTDCLLYTSDAADE